MTRTCPRGALAVAALLAGILLAAGPIGAGEAGGWPPADEADIRPGVNVAGGCTSSFLFRSPDNETLYLGTQGHCLPESEVGDPVQIEFGAYTGTLAYLAYDAYVPGKDFALVRLHDDYREEVHPAVLYWGGPTGLARDVDPGDVVETFGNSPYREPLWYVAGQDPPFPPPGNALDPRRGVVVNRTENVTSAYYAPSGFLGDSGSPVMTRDGRAVGSLIGLSYAGTNAATNLGPRLEEARSSGMDVELVTWRSFDPVLPHVTDDPGTGPARPGGGARYETGESPRGGGQLGTLRRYGVGAPAPRGADPFIGVEKKSPPTVLAVGEANGCCVT